MEKHELVSKRDRKQTTVRIDAEKCGRCGGCIDLCPVIAISMINDIVVVDGERCEECIHCVSICPLDAPYGA